MALHYLDPRQAGTGAAPNVDVYVSPVDTQWSADILTEPSPVQCSFGGYDTESAALRAAREAAGFGHVAERPCDTEQRLVNLDVRDRVRMADDECDVCAWSRDAHKEGSK